MANESKINKEFFKTLKMNVMDKEFIIIRSKKFYPDAFANIKASDYYTVIIESKKMKKRDVIDVAKSFKIIQFETIIPINLVGFIAEIANTLARENISILLVSSYSTDHIIIQKKDLKKTIRALKKMGVKM